MMNNDTSTAYTPNTSMSDPLGRTQLQIRLELSLAIVICLVAFTGNSLVVMAIHYDQRLKTITNMLIENLAFTDILMASLHMPFRIVSQRYGRWVFGQALCELAGVTQMIFGISSLYTMAAIAINRYFKICKRNLYLKYFSTKKVTYYMILIAWVGPIVTTTPQVYGWGKIAYQDLFSDCTCMNDSSDTSYIISICFVTIFLNAAVISCCYYTIYKTVKASAQRMQEHAANSNEQNNATCKTETETKILKTSFVVVCVYMACWMPLAAVGFIGVIGAESPRWVYVFAGYFHFCSSLTNPFIYGIMNRRFQYTYKKLLRIRVNDVQAVNQLCRANGKGAKIAMVESHRLKICKPPSTGAMVNGLPEDEEQSNVSVKSSATDA